MHSATSPRPGERAKCSAWAKALGKPGDCVRPDGPEVGAEQPKFKRIGANKSSDSSRLPRSDAVSGGTIRRRQAAAVPCHPPSSRIAGPIKS